MHNKHLTYRLCCCIAGLQGQLGDGSYRQACWTPKCIVGVDNTSSLVSQNPDFDTRSILLRYS